MTPPSPNLITLDQYMYLDNRNRKLLKLCILKEKSLAQNKKKSFVQLASSGRSIEASMNNILPKIDDTNLSKAES
jgi:hypothetical protein